MPLADVAGPVGLGCLFLGMAVFGESHWTALGVVLAAMGIVLLFVSR